MVEYRPMVDNIDPVASLWMREWITPWIMIKLYHYNGTKLKDFYMGPSVKFVLPIIDAFPDKKNGGNFWCGKKGRNGGGWGGSEGVAFFGRKFSRLSFLNTSLTCLRFFQEAEAINVWDRGCSWSGCYTSFLPLITHLFQPALSKQDINPQN